MEQEQEVEIEDTFDRKKYSREDNQDMPWFFATIANRPDEQLNGFYPMSSFVSTCLRFVNRLICLRFAKHSTC